VALFLVVSALTVLAAGARDQELVLFYAVSVFVSFLAGMLAMARFTRQERRWASFVLNVAGAVLVVFTLVVDLKRVLPIASLGAAGLIAGFLYGSWVRAGRPTGVAEAEALAER
jgi:hypothetical protein